MPDIAKCESKDCPLKEKCYRYTCEPDEIWQSYSDFTDSLNEDKTECKHFMEIWKKS